MTVLAGWPAVSHSDGWPDFGHGCVQLCYIVCMAIGLWWDHPSGEYVRTRSSRYPGATDIEPAWTLEAAADPHRITRDPDPKSHRGDIRVVGYSPAAGFVITVIIDQVDHSGINAWKTSGADLRAYRAARGGEDDAS
jgi:hypothetical protein